MKAMSKIWQKQATMIDKQLSENQDEDLNTAIENVRNDKTSKRKRKLDNVIEQDKDTSKKKKGTKQKGTTTTLRVQEGAPNSPPIVSNIPCSSTLAALYFLLIYYESGWIIADHTHHIRGYN